MTKFTFIPDDTVTLNDETKLTRIVATRDIPAYRVRMGDKGGYIAKLENLSQSGNAWVYGDAWVSGNAQVYGNAQVFGNAQVYGDARVYGNAQVYGDARVYGDADIFIIGPALSSGRYTTAYRTQNGIGVTCGCFTGTLAEFEKIIEETHAGAPAAHLQQYRMFRRVIEENFSL